MLQTHQTKAISHLATGEHNRAARTKKKVSIRALATEMNISAPYLSDLERGRRNWSEHLDSSFTTCLKRLSARHPLT